MTRNIEKATSEGEALRAGEKQLLRSLAMNYPAGIDDPEHEHDWGQLVYAAHGALRVETAAAAWILPRNRALWLPSGVRHRLRSQSAVKLRTLYFPPSFATGFPLEPTLPSRAS